MDKRGFHHRHAHNARRKSEDASPRRPTSSNAHRSHCGGSNASSPSSRSTPDGYHNGFDENIVPDEIVTINVSGQRYETRLSTLHRFPDSLLGNPARRKVFYESSQNEYFFERSRKSFSSILDYYQTGGTLRRPVNVAFHAFVAEIIFFELGDEVLRNFLQNEDMLQVKSVVPKGTIQNAVWQLFENPTSSRMAQILAACNVILVIVAVINFCIQTLPEYQVVENAGTARDLSTILGIGITANHTIVTGVIKGILTPFFVAETLCNSWFLLDLVVRFSVSPIKKTFFFQFMNVVDALSVFPYFIDLLSLVDSADAPAKHGLFLLILFRLFRILRIFRILKLSRYSDGLEILWLTMKSAKEELGVLLMLIAIGMTLFSASIYYAELGYLDSDFPSIPHTFWFTIITWTSVGYGDMVPKHPIGKLIGGICSATGVLCLAFIVPVVVTHFEYYFHRGKELRKLQIVLDRSTRARDLRARFVAGRGEVTGQNGYFNTDDFMESFGVIAEEPKRIRTFCSSL
ncbi:Potassium voltage-gated channel subfamily A member 2 [Hypsibius exemplaris]|uniref:Potassium voltage-gated channel subfamily A member 2 n=1 Tax=Hypsibius exemplaris TaxID=2072580 RepID=A0A1W0X8Z6_HYPEX|nr:Potassium voltage-gated channel subfamily A member 2 [Hypsibius exemplaris]